jgi:hypothetical protein
MCYTFHFSNYRYYYNKVLLIKLAQDWTGAKCSYNLGYEMVALLIYVLKGYCSYIGLCN